MDIIEYPGVQHCHIILTSWPQSTMNRIEKEVESVQKDTLIKLMLSPDKHSCQKRKTQPANSPLRSVESIQELDFDDYIKWCHGYRHRPNIKKVERLCQGDIYSKITEDNYRLFVMVLSGASYHQVNDPNYFDIVIRSKCLYPPLYFSSIEKDVHRTLTSSNLHLESLRRVLSAYAIRNPNLLYCQGLNVIAANLLLSQFSEVESFWLLTCLIEEILPFDCFVNLKPIVCLNSIFNDLIKSLLPDFITFCQGICLETSFFFVTWMVTLFGKGFSRELMRHFLIVIVLEREIGLVKIALTVTKLLYPYLQHVEDFGAALKLIESQQKQISLSEFRAEYQKLYLHPVLFRLLLTQYIDDYPQEEMSSFTRKINLKRRTLPHCNPEYEVCLHVVEVEKDLRGMKEMQTLRMKAPLEQLLEDDYFNTTHVNRRKSKSFLRAEFLEQIAIGRHTHICTQEIRSRIKPSTFLIEEEVEEDFQNLAEGELRIRDLSPSTSSLYQELSGQFEVVEQEISEEFSQLREEDEEIEIKERQSIIKSLATNSSSVKINKFSAKSVIKQAILGLFHKGKK